MSEVYGTTVGTVVGNTSPQDFSFYLKSFKAKLEVLLIRHQIGLRVKPAIGNENMIIYNEFRLYNMLYAVAKPWIDESKD